MTPELFIGFATGTAVGFFIAAIFASAKFGELYTENQKLRVAYKAVSDHPSMLDPDFDILGDWGSALDGWTDNEDS